MPDDPRTPYDGHLGRFGHHPDPAIDFCVEVEELEGLTYNVEHGMDDRQPVALRIDRAMGFRVGGDLFAIAAKGLLRTLEQRVGREKPPMPNETQALDFAITAAALRSGGTMRQAADTINAFLRSLPDAGLNRCSEEWLNGWSLHGLADGVKERGDARR